MSRNASGVHSLPNSITAGETLSAAPVQANFADLSAEVTASLPRAGTAGMTAPLPLANGSASLPGLTFASDTNTGFFRKSADVIGIATAGTEVASIDSIGLIDANAFRIVGLPTGAMIMYGATAAPSGWLRCNGRTIGNASSSATERADADTVSLFTFLWTHYDNSALAVSSGRGASAAADYAANKTIALPDLRGRAFFGLDDMGNSAASRIGTIIPGPTTNGSSGGTETHTLTEAQLPVIDPAGSVAITDPGHVHTFAQTTFTASASSNNTVSVGTTLSTQNTGSATTGITASFNGTPFGSGAAHSNMPPTFLTTFIIKL